jgi:hypothetical protein
MANSEGGVQLVDVSDPPVPGRSTPVVDKSLGVKLKEALRLIAVGLLLVGVSVGLWRWGFRIYPFVLGGFGVLCVVGGLSGSLRRADCPFCRGDVDAISGKEGEFARCPVCSEYSVVNAGLLRPLDPSTTSPDPKFESPVYINMAWPRGCVECGEPPVKFADLSKINVGAAAAVVGVLSVARARVRGVPYCDKHKDAVALGLGVDNKTVYLKWRSLRMMRRYLVANRRRPVYKG